MAASYGRGSTLGGEPVVHALLEQVERQRTGTEQCVVKGADVEAIAQRDLGAAADGLHFQLPDLVGERLPGPAASATTLACIRTPTRVSAS